MKEKLFNFLFPSIAQEYHSTQNALDFHFAKGSALAKALNEAEHKLYLSQEVVEIQGNEISIIKGKLHNEANLVKEHTSYFQNCIASLEDELDNKKLSLNIAEKTIKILEDRHKELEVKILQLNHKKEITSLKEASTQVAQSSREIKNTVYSKSTLLVARYNWENFFYRAFCFANPKCIKNFIHFFEVINKERENIKVSLFVEKLFSILEEQRVKTPKTKRLDTLLISAIGAERAKAEYGVSLSK